MREREKITREECNNKAKPQRHKLPYPARLLPLCLNVLKTASVHADLENRCVAMATRAQSKITPSACPREKSCANIARSARKEHLY